MITANSGFFESIRGSSRIIKGVLSEQDIISAPLAPEATTSMLSRFVGAGGIGGALANVMSKARGAMMPSAPAAGGGKTGAGMSGGAKSSGVKGLQARLM